ncbi:MAG: hypothetical protein KF693_01705 [Nitrospira sp.]|nr:hypothetical protein [Nitrospira sp.]
MSQETPPNQKPTEASKFVAPTSISFVKPQQPGGLIPSVPDKPTKTGELTLNQGRTLTETESTNHMRVLFLEASGPLRSGFIPGTTLPVSFSDIRINLTYTVAKQPTTAYDWGTWLNRVNTSPFQDYVKATQSNTSIVPVGADTYFPSLTQQSGQRWGDVVFGLQSIRGSSRYGGSFHVTLAPIEDFGFEVADLESGVYLNLTQWLLHIYIRANGSLFTNNQTLGPPANSLINSTAIEIEAPGVEAYSVNNGVVVLNSAVTQKQIDGLLTAAAQQAVQRLDLLLRFTLGFVHHQYLPNFNRVSQRITASYVSDGAIAFVSAQRNPYVKIMVKCHFFKADLVGKHELTAMPWIIGRKKPFVVFSFEHKKYLGAGDETPFITMGYVPLKEFATVNEVSVFANWREKDLLLDDKAISNAIVFNVIFDATALQNRANNNNLGPIGDGLRGFSNDLRMFRDVGVQVAFELVKL